MNGFFWEPVSRLAEAEGGDPTGVPLIPAPHSLAILRTRHQIYEETKDIWIFYMTFNFYYLESMLDKFSSLSPHTLSRIGYACVGGRSVRLCPLFLTYDFCYKISWVLKLLPNLDLKVLTVFGMMSGEVAYDALQGLIKYGNGWEELQFITPTSEMMGFAEREPCRRRPQPSSWRSMLRKREGLRSHENRRTTVRIYRATQPSKVNEPSGIVLNPVMRERFEQRVPDSTESRAWFGVEKDMDLMSKDEIDKELLVIVKRDRSADIAKGSERRRWYNDERDIRSAGDPAMTFHTWESIRHRLYEKRGKVRPLVDECVKTDFYYNVFDFHWSQYLG